MRPSLWAPPARSWRFASVGARRPKPAEEVVVDPVSLLGGRAVATGRLAERGADGSPNFGTGTGVTLTAVRLGALSVGLAAFEAGLDMYRQL